MKRLAALTLVAAGLLLLSGLVWSQLAESHATGEAQQRLLGSVPDGPRSEGESRALPVATAVPTGHALAVLRIPRFGHDWEWVVAEGTAEHVIADGPGHYAGTALPGERGNAAFAAHRAGHGDPFIDFDQLLPGDEVRFSQGSTTWVYLVDTRPRIVPVSSTWLLEPLDGWRLTLTTCWPKYGSSQRMFVLGHLDRVERPDARTGPYRSVPVTGGTSRGTPSASAR